MSEIREWLKVIGLGQYADAFEGGEDYRQLPLWRRKTNLARLLRRRIPGIFIAEYEQGEVGRDIPRRLQYGPSRSAAIALRAWQMQALGQDEKPRASGL
jgi:hypothetical protein